MSAQHTAAFGGIQTTIEGVQPPPAPTRTPDFVMQAVLDYVTRNQLWSDKPAQEVAEHICEELYAGANGYDLAKALDNNHYWQISVQDVEDLDGVETAVRQALREARKQWALEWNIQPPHQNGTRVKFRHGTGVIAGVSDFDGATYLVKKDGCTQEGQFSLVPFEEAVALEDEVAK